MIPFDVNDAALRREFYGRLLFERLERLKSDERARWGDMTAQQMVEHLEWSFEAAVNSIPKEGAPSAAPAARERLMRFLHNDHPTPHGFTNPLLTDGLPPLRHADLAKAIDALRAAVERCVKWWDDSPDTLRLHPVFGPLDADGWSRALFKHSYHHLLQFGLIREERDP